jgi:formyltetrahydrofolate synthetase
MRKLFILVTVAFALVSIGAATVVTSALTSDVAMAQAVRRPALGPRHGLDGGAEGIGHSTPKIQPLYLCDL